MNIGEKHWAHVFDVQCQISEISQICGHIIDIFIIMCQATGTTSNLKMAYMSRTTC